MPISSFHCCLPERLSSVTIFDKSVALGTDQLVNISISSYYHVLRKNVTCDIFSEANYTFYRKQKIISKICDGYLSY